MKRFDLAGGFAGLTLALSAGWATGQVPVQSPVVQHPASTSALPATPSTSAPAVPAVTKPLTPDQLPPHRAVVAFANGRLSVEANNSSLNQILWAIGQQMGMTITGGVQDERVYGSYGPDDPATVLSALIDGTNSNMLLKTGAQGGSELVLTTRGGGPTPPSPGPGPDVAADDAKEDLPPQQTRPRPTVAAAPSAPAAAPASPAAPATPAAQAVVAPAAAMPVAPATVTPVAVTPATTSAAATTTQASPNGVKTPDQIFQQLLKLQQAQAKAAAPATTPVTATSPTSPTATPPQP